MAKLPLELKGAILSWLGDGTEKEQFWPRSISRDFYAASAIGLPQVNDRIYSGYLRRLLRQTQPLDRGELEHFFAERAPLLRHADLRDSFTAQDPAKTELLFRLLRERSTPLLSLDLRHCTALKTLPENLRVDGDLVLFGSGINSLPPNLTVKGNLSLDGCPLTQLPARLRVGQELSLSNCRVTHLPDDIELGGSVFAMGSALAHLPRNLRRVQGDLDICLTPLRTLPAGFSVSGILAFGWGAPFRLPTELSVGSLHPSGLLALTYLPDFLTVADDLDLVGSSFETLPRGLRVRGNLDLRDTYIARFPQDCAIGGTVFFAGSAMEQTLATCQTKMETLLADDALTHEDKQLVASTISTAQTLLHSRMFSFPQGERNGLVLLDLIEDEP